MSARPIPFVDLRTMADEVWNAVARQLRPTVLDAEFAAGPAVDRFEADWARHCGATYAVGVASGTDALHLALRALGVGPGDEVVVPSLAFVSVAEAVVLAGATPRFADVDPDTLLLTGDTLARAATSRTRAAVAVHLYGQPANMDELGAVAEAHGLRLVEDASHAHGAQWGERAVGSLADAGCFSFDPEANLGAFGDAGAVVTSDAALARRVRSLADHGRAAGSHFRHDEIGTGSRLDAVQAVVLREKLDRLERWVLARQRVASRYLVRLRDLPGTGPVGCHQQAAHAYHRFVIRVPDRDLVRAELARLGVETRVEYALPCHLQPAFSQFADGPLPHSESAAAEVLSLPMYPHLTSAQIDRVVQALTAARRAPVASGTVAT
jgi:dTDP-4-amino-4,6-dideoxygalactose transaminase